MYVPMIMLLKCKVNIFLNKYSVILQLLKLDPCYVTNTCRNGVPWNVVRYLAQLLTTSTNIVTAAEHSYKTVTKGLC